MRGRERGLHRSTALTSLTRTDNRNLSELVFDLDMKDGDLFTCAAELSGKVVSACRFEVEIHSHLAMNNGNTDRG